MHLRLCTDALNPQNSGPRKGSSRFKCVSWRAARGKWLVAFRFDGKHYHVGHFDCEIEAALAYNDAIKPLAGEFARLNDVSDFTAA